MSGTTESQPTTRPPRYKMALLTWVGAYAAITVILDRLGPMMATWPLMARTLVISVLMVLTLTWVLIPLLTRLFRGWLVSGSDRPAKGAISSPSASRLRPSRARGSTPLAAG